MLYDVLMYCWRLDSVGKSNVRFYSYVCILQLCGVCRGRTCGSVGKGLVECVMEDHDHKHGYPVGSYQARLSY
jgi:hypothetical protein